jgi:HD-like signal output (HDOD) protein
MIPDICSNPSAEQHAGVADRLSKLPPFRPACLQLLAISTDAYSAMEDFAKIFLADPAMAADLLLVANSMEFGSRSRVETIRHALSFLGLERVRSLASTIALRVSMRDTFHESLRPLWLHSIATAVIAEQLGVLHDVPGVYTAALVHDLGRLGLFAAEHERYSIVLGTVFDDLDESNRMEEVLFGMDHCKAGAFLGEKWGFPIGLQASMVAHHDTGQMSPPRRLVQRACALAESLGFPEVQRRDQEVSDTVCQKAGLAPDAIREEISQRIAMLGEAKPSAAPPPATPPAAAWRPSR